MDIPQKNTELRKLKNKELQLDDLIECSARLVPLYSGRQTRYKVTNLPNKRAIRYYVQEGLVDKPLRKGRNAVFTYRHLLQILVVKKLQSGYYPLKKIIEATQGMDNEELERLLAVDSPLLAISQPPRNALPPVRDHAPSALFNETSSDCGCASWRRFKIDERVELHIEEQFDPLHPHIDLDVIAARIMHVLSVLSAENGDWTVYEATSALPPKGQRTFFLPASPVPCLSDAVVALITEGGLVPKGNPDRLESARASKFLKYPIEGLDDLERDFFESVDRGWDTTDVNANPNRLLPVDVMRDLERERVIGKIHECFFTTTGVAMSVDGAHQIGKEIAAELRKAEVSSAVLTAT